MAIVIGIVSKERALAIDRAGYPRAWGVPGVESTLVDMQRDCSDDDTPVAVWVDCNVDDLLILDEVEE